MDRFEAMNVLLAAVDSGSLSQASRRLGLPLATVSRRVADLEAHLKADLLIRSSRGLELTPSGRSYVAAAKRSWSRSTRPSAPPPASTPRRAATWSSPPR